MNPSSPVTGATVTGLTSNTYTIVADLAPSANSKQWYVSTLGGTQPGVSVHSTSSPFTVAIFRPTNIKVLGALDQSNQLTRVPKNTITLVIRKGAVPLAGQPAAICISRCNFEIPAGTDTASPAELKGFFSFIGGFIFANAQGLVDAALSNTI